MTKKRNYNVSFIVVLLVLFFALSGMSCDAHENSVQENAGELSADKIVLSEDTYHVMIRLTGTDVQSGKIEAQMLNSKRSIIGIDSYTPADEIEMKFAYSDDLNTVAITWSKEDNMPLCDPLTLSFDRIYAADWKALANATHRMDLLYGGKVQVEDGSSEYASGRLIVKTKEELPDISEFHVAMIVIDDEEHCFLQFEKSDDAKKCAEYLKTSPNIEYVDIDGVVTVS